MKYKTKGVKNNKSNGNYSDIDGQMVKIFSKHKNNYLKEDKIRLLDCLILYSIKRS